MLAISVIIFPLLLLSFNNVSVIGVESEDDNQECSSPSESVVRLVNSYNIFLSNGFSYKSDDEYSYIISSADVVNKTKEIIVALNDGEYFEASLVGKDDMNNISVFKIGKNEKLKNICLANSNFLHRGQKNYLYGYINNKDDFMAVSYLSSIGQLYTSSDYYNIYKSVIDTKWFEGINGTGVFDEYDRLVGIVNGNDDKLEGGSFITVSNKLNKIADSIIKNGNYKVNRLKYTIVDYGSLSSRLKKNYGVSGNVSEGVVITSFKPLNYVFGGLNQGMTIIAVNGVEISNCYELDREITRYNKGSKVCLKVVKKNGKEAFYCVKL